MLCGNKSNVYCEIFFATKPDVLQLVASLMQDYYYVDGVYIKHAERQNLIFQLLTFKELYNPLNVSFSFCYRLWYVLIVALIATR